MPKTKELWSLGKPCTLTRSDGSTPQLSIEVLMQERDRVLRLLICTKQLVLKGWTQKAFARNALGHPVDPSHHSAVSWCLIGALNAAREKLGIRDIEVKESAAWCIADPNAMRWLILWNDGPLCTIEDVVSRIDKAINRLRSLEK